MNRTTLNKATSPDATPTPGYLFDEIAKVTHDPLGNDRLVDYLVRRLESPSPDVKAKVLNIVKHVCRKGNHAFRRAWQREAGVIKAHLQYHTAPDPLRGDEPSKRVREAAKEALEAVFDASRDERKTDPALAGRIQGFGVSPAPAGPNSPAHDYPSASSSVPTAYAQPAHASSGSSSSAPAARFSGSSRYEGIGNPAFADPRNQPKTMLERVADVVREKVEKHAETIPGVAGVKPAWMTQGAADLPSGYPFASNRGGSSYTASSGSYDPTLSQRTTVDNVWSDPRNSRPSFGVSGAPIATAQPVVPSGGVKPIRTSERSDGRYEETLVNELCAPGGVRPVPAKDQLDNFSRACRTLDAEWVITHLNAKMLDDDWKVQHKALCVLEMILQTPGLEAYADQLDRAPDVLEALYNAKNPSVREKAQKVWRILYEDEEAKNGGISEQKSSQQEADLLGSAPSPTKSHRDTASEMNLLDFESTTTPQMQTPNLLFGSSPPLVAPPTQSPKPQSPTAAALPNMFQNMSVKGGAPPKLPGVSAPSGATTAGPSSGFSFLSSSGAPSALASQPDLFGFSMHAQPAATKPSTAPAPMDLFSMPISTAPATFANTPLAIPSATNSFPASSIPGIGKPMITGSSGVASSGIATKKPADSFNFVQEALQSTRKV